MPGAVAIGVDTGGTNVHGLLVEVESGTVLDRRRADTPASDPAAIAKTIVEVVRELVGSVDGVGAVGVGAAGLVQLGGIVRFAPNLAWKDLPLREIVEDGVGIPTLVDNDATVAAWGEFLFGAGRGSTDILMVTVGTGIGGGIVSGGTLLRGAHGFAGEIGHMIVDPAGPRCGCGAVGCWEQVASGRAVGRLGREAATKHPDSLLARLASGNADGVTGPLVTQAAQQGDPVAVAVFDEVGRRLGEGIAGYVNALDPDVVVVGGGVIAAGDLLLEPARRAYLATVMGVDHRPEVPMLAAALGNDAGAVGAAELAWRELVAG
jgi:glucokinase